MANATTAKYFIPDSVKADINAKLGAGVYDAVKGSLESTGKAPEGVNGLNGIINGRIKTLDDFRADLTKAPVSTLDETGLKDRLSVLQYLQQNPKVSVDSGAINGVLYPYLRQITDTRVADSAIQQASDYINQSLQSGSFDPAKAAGILGSGWASGDRAPDQQYFLNQANNAANRIRGEIASRTKTEDFTPHLTETQKALKDFQTQAVMNQRQTEQDQLAAGQRGKSDALFQQALQALQTPAPQYTPEFTQAMLDQIQQQVLGQGQSALSDVEADATRRGISGSSIEAFGAATTQGKIADALSKATLDFLGQAGQAGQRNREFNAQSLFNAAGAYLGAGQQSTGLGASTAITGQQMDLQREQLATQIQQFNQSLAQSQQQFQQSLQYQQQQAVQNMQLLMQQLNRGQSRNIVGGTLQGLGTGATVGALAGGPWGALIGAGVGGLGYGLGSAYGG